MRRCHLLAFDFNPSVAIVGAGDAKRHDLQVALYFFIFEAAADQTLDGEQRVLRVGNSLTLSRLADQDFTVIGVSNDGRSCTIAFGVFNHASVVTIQNGNTRVGRTQVNTDDSTHFKSPKICKKNAFNLSLSH